MTQPPMTQPPPVPPHADHPPESIAAGPMSARPSAPAPPGSKVIEGTVQKLRAELANVKEKPRQARLLGEIGELEERVGDEPAAARDYLAAFNADPLFRE